MSHAHANGNGHLNGHAHINGTSSPPTTAPPSSSTSTVVEVNSLRTDPQPNPADHTGVTSQHRIVVNNPAVRYSDDCIDSTYLYEKNHVDLDQATKTVRITPNKHLYRFRTQRTVPRVGVMLVGWGGNNGSTVTAAIEANKRGLTWMRKEGKQSSNYFGSLTQATTIRIGSNQHGKEVHIPFSSILPMVHPNDLVIGGWDINGANIAAAMERACVLDYDLQRQLAPLLTPLQPLPSIYYPDFIAANQSDRADNLIPTGTKAQDLAHLRRDIAQFKAANKLEKVIVLWTANTERFTDVRAGLNMTADELLASIERGDEEVSPSQIFAVASILEGCPYINGSPQNTIVPGVIDLAKRHRVFVGGDDFKSGQTKMKSVLVDFLVSAGIKPQSIVSYNHLGNNDGKNLSAPQQFRSKEISKSNVVDDMVAANHILYAPNEHPDHCVVIKYVPFVKDSKRALDEYLSTIFMNGLSDTHTAQHCTTLTLLQPHRQQPNIHPRFASCSLLGPCALCGCRVSRSTIAMHNTCEDSLLASPLIIDLVVLTELMTRITYSTNDNQEYEPFEPVLSILSYLLKAPMVMPGTPVVNALMKQHRCITNILSACAGISMDTDMLLEYKTKLPQPEPIKQ